MITGSDESLIRTKNATFCDFQREAHFAQGAALEIGLNRIQIRIGVNEPQMRRVGWGVVDEGHHEAREAGRDACFWSDVWCSRTTWGQGKLGREMDTIYLAFVLYCSKYLSLSATNSLGSQKLDLTLPSQVV